MKANGGGSSIVVVKSPVSWDVDQDKHCHGQRLSHQVLRSESSVLILVTSVFSLNGNR